MTPSWSRKGKPRCSIPLEAAAGGSSGRAVSYTHLRGTLLPTSSDIYAMFTAAMIESLPPQRQEFLAVMGLADEFTVEMASAVTRMPDAEQVLLALRCV